MWPGYMRYVCGQDIRGRILSQLCWHNFRIICTVLRRIGIENNAGIIGEY